MKCLVQGIFCFGTVLAFKYYEIKNGGEIMKNNAIIANSKDNVVTVVQELKMGDVLKINGANGSINFEVTQDVPCFHKVALVDIQKGEEIVKYGEVIGDALEDIKKGQHVHVHNVESKRGRGDKK